MFERFTEGARQVVVLAQDEARALKHNYIGTEHILLGLLREDQGLAAEALASLNIPIDEVRAQVARIVGHGDGPTSGQIPFTPRSRKVLELGLREGLNLGHNYIGTEHILLGLVRENEGVAARILLDLGADAELVRAEVMGLLNGTTGGGNHWMWRMLARDVNQAQQAPKPSDDVLAMSFRQVTDAMNDAADAAIAAQDVTKARELTRLRGEVLDTARWVQAVLRPDTPNAPTDGM